MNAQTSDKISSLAAKYATMTPDRLLSLTATAELRRKTSDDIKSMAASLLRQDEVRGFRKIINKVLGVAA